MVAGLCFRNKPQVVVNIKKRKKIPDCFHIVKINTANQPIVVPGDLRTVLWGGQMKYPMVVHPNAAKNFRRFYKHSATVKVGGPEKLNTIFYPLVSLQ